MNLLPHVQRPVGAALVLALALALPAAPVAAQSASAAAELRIKKLEAEVQALQRQVFPGADGKYFPPQVQPGQTAAPQPGTPATTPVTDLLTRVDALEAQLARLTAQNEEAGNKLAQLQAKVDGQTAAPPAAPTAATATTAANLAAMTGGASPPLTKPATPAPAPARTSATTPKPAAPSAQRLAAVEAVAKPKTADPGDDEYSYGFRLYDAKLYPEAEQQLELFLQKYPKHARVSHARNLLGKAYLDEGNPREAGAWFVKNYTTDKTGARAADSLLNLADSMKRIKDTKRECIALAQFVDDYPAEAAGRLKAQYDALNREAKCN